MHIMGNPKDFLKWQAPSKPRQQLKFVVTIPPSSNKAFYNGRRGVKNFAKLWMSKCRAYVLKVMKETGYIQEPALKGSEEVQVWFYIDMVFYFA